MLTAASLPVLLLAVSAWAGDAPLIGTAGLAASRPVLLLAVSAWAGDYGATRAALH